MPGAEENLLKLPEVAYHRHPQSGRVIRLKRGESDFYIYYTDKTPEELNRAAGVTPAQAEAMLMSSIISRSGEPMPGAEENLLKLPEVAYHRHPQSGRVIRLRRGESDFYIYYTDKTPEELNRAIGVTPAQAEAMLMGSMYGWHTKAANPDNYDANGKCKLC